MAIAVPAEADPFLKLNGGEQDANERRMELLEKLHPRRRAVPRRKAIEIELRPAEFDFVGAESRRYVDPQQSQHLGRVDVMPGFGRGVIHRSSFPNLIVR